MMKILYSTILKNCETCLLFQNNKCVKDNVGCKYDVVTTRNNFGMHSVFNVISKYPCEIRECPMKEKYESIG